MRLKFNIDEIFEIAEQIERNGARFYSDSADIVPANSPSHKLLITLAEMEIKHEAIFASMRKDIITHEKMDSIMDPYFDPDGIAGMYLKSIADGQVFDINQPLLNRNESIETILKLALDREKDSIIFYLGIKEAISENLIQKNIDIIIKEEISHIAYITSVLFNNIKR